MRQRRLASLCVLLSALLFVGFAAAPATAATVNYVALGDSYSSGVGTSGASGLCLQSPQGYPSLWAASHSVNSFIDAACSGAVTANVRSLQVYALSSSTSIVTISIGGNDVGFAGTILTCTLLSNSSCLSAVAASASDAENTLPGNLDSTYALIRRHAPNAKVYVLGYPRLFETGSCTGGLSLTKRTAINNAADELAGIIAGRAAAAGFQYVDVRSNFAGHGICSPTPWVNAFSLSVSSYHPTATGYLNGYLPALDAYTG